MASRHFAGRVPPKLPGSQQFAANIGRWHSGHRNGRKGAIVIAGPLAANDNRRIRLRKRDMPASRRHGQSPIVPPFAPPPLMAMIGGTMATNGGRFLVSAGLLVAVVTAGGTEIHAHRAIATEAQIQRRAAPANNWVSASTVVSSNRGMLQELPGGYTSLHHHHRHPATQSVAIFLWWPGWTVGSPVDHSGGCLLLSLHYGR